MCALAARAMAVGNPLGRKQGSETDSAAKALTIGRDGNHMTGSNA